MGVFEVLLCAVGGLPALLATIFVLRHADRTRAFPWLSTAVLALAGALSVALGCVVAAATVVWWMPVPTMPVPVAVTSDWAPIWAGLWLGFAFVLPVLAGLITIGLTRRGGAGWAVAVLGGSLGVVAGLLVGITIPEPGPWAVSASGLIDARVDAAWNAMAVGVAAPLGIVLGVNRPVMTLFATLAVPGGALALAALQTPPDPFSQVFVAAAIMVSWMAGAVPGGMLGWWLGRGGETTRPS